jgi:methylmalonyl-CoA mutase
MKNLFKEFNPVTAKQWKQQIQFELNGLDYNETLVWESPEGIKVKPFYNSEDTTKTYFHRKESGFRIAQPIFVHNVEKSIIRAKNSINRGAESIIFSIPNSDIDIQKLLNSIPLEKVAVFFDMHFLSSEFIEKINSIQENKKTNFFYNLDPIGHFAKEGNWFSTLEKDNFETLKKIVQISQNNSFLSVNTSLYQNAGANMVQQIAYSVAHANEYFHEISGLKSTIVFQVAVGTNYFFEIAKLRALRILFNRIAKEYNHNFDCHILAMPTKRNKTIYDYNVNMLRTTTECMSSILGGADTICNLAYDSIYHKDNEFGDRIAINQLLILKNESYFEQIYNAADGSYYIESLTQQLAEKALILFKEIEKNGGFLILLKKGEINQKINENALKEQNLFDSGKEILVGTNKFQNKKDFMKNDLELFPFLKQKPRKTIIKPILEKRWSENIEQERLLTEN